MELDQTIRTQRGSWIYLQRFATYFTKMFYGKSTFHMQSQDYIKTMMLNFINKKCEIFNLKRFKIVLLATINLIIVTTLLLLNLYTVLLLRIYDQRRQLDNILIKDVVTSRNIAFERVKSKK